MQTINKKGNDQLSDFLRYRGNEMTDRERNAFEKSLQDDLFAAEAAEGFIETDQILAEKDISEIGQRLIRRTSAKRRMLWYRIAASVAALMILSSIFIFEETKKPSEQIVRTSESPEIKETSVLPQMRPENDGITDQMPVASDNRKQVQSEMKESEGISNKKEEYISEEIQAENQLAITGFEATNTLITTEADSISSRFAEIRGKIISSEDKKPIQGSRVTLNETLKDSFTNTAGNFRFELKKAADSTFVSHFLITEKKAYYYENKINMESIPDKIFPLRRDTVVEVSGLKEEGMGLKEALKGYTPPQPANGKADFDKYIRDHIKRPDTITTGQRVVVVLSFIVEKTGKTDSLKVLKSPGKPFSDEAIRLIREGPSWIPAQENGETIRDEVRIRIVFK
jgi:TonB family protein